jgi:hypothetical protein
MPQTVNCSKCGTILYQGEELKPYDEIIMALNGKCSNCGKQLYTPDKMIVKVVPTINKKLETVPLPTTSGESKYTTEERKYKALLITKLTSAQPTENIEVNFLDVFQNGINVLLEKFGLYDVSREIHLVGGFKRIRNDVIICIRLSLDNELYSHSKHIVEANFMENRCTYYERKDPFTNPNWKKMDLKDVPLYEREKNRTILLKRFDKIVELIEKHKRPIQLKNK